MDYKLADLIGYSMARLHSSSNKMPEITKVYPFLNTEENERKQAEAKAEVSALRFKLFAQAYNNKYKGDADN